MLRVLIAIVFVVSAALLGAPTSSRVAESHPGGTDGNGCHTCRTNCTERWGIPYGYYHRHYPVRPCFSSSGSSPAPTAPPPLSSLYAARPISAAQGCNAPGQAMVTFTWARGLIAGDVQYLDLSLSNNGFLWGTFVGAGPLSGFTTTYTWAGLRPRATHYYRINTAGAGSWHPSGTFSFTTRSC